MHLWPEEFGMDVETFKFVSAPVLLLVSLVGGGLAIKIEQGQSTVAHGMAYAFSGGILVAVALVHMLADASEDLVEAGKVFSKALGGNGEAAFPLGNALFVLGFLIITVVETILHNYMGAHEVHDALAARELQHLEKSSTSNTGGWAALAGLSIHSVVEGLAAGATQDEVDVGFIVIAIACHKGFAAFALAAANLPLWRSDRKRTWIAVVVWFAWSGSLGIVLGILISSSIEGAMTAAITCLAAGSLMSVGISEMLVPALQDGRWICGKLLMATGSILTMSLLAMWA